MTGRADGRDADDPAAGSGTGTAVVIVNYESGPALVSCVEGWRGEHPDQLLVVDNGSTDGSVHQLGLCTSEVEVLVTGRNLGYGAAANRGVAATTAPLVLVCNPDLEVRPGALAALSRALVDDPRRGLVGPLIRNRHGDRYPSARRFPSMVDAAGHALLGIFAPDNRFTHSYQQTGLETTGTGPLTVDWVSGACFLVRRTAFEQVGGFDEAYFMYAEDVDLCWRLGSNGWSVGYVTDAEVVHLQGISTDRSPYRMIAEHHRSLMRFAVRSTRGWRRILLPLVALGISVRAALACLARATASQPVATGAPGPKR